MKRGTPRHRKMRRLADLLGIPLPYAVGLMEMLWHWVGQEMPQGNIGLAKDREIAAACGWPKKPQVLVEALVEAGWLDRHEEHRLLVHDWEEHCEEAVRKWLKRSGRDFITPSGGSLGKTTPVIYFLQASKSKLVKIGFTEGPVWNRICALQIGSPEKLILLGTMPGTRWAELQLHRQFADCSEAGEWFRSEPPLMEFISANAEAPNGETLAAEVATNCGPPAHARALARARGSDSEDSVSKETSEPRARVNIPARRNGVTDEQWPIFLDEAIAHGMKGSEVDWDNASWEWGKLDIGERMAAIQGLPRDLVGKENCLPVNYLRKKMWQRPERRASPTGGESAVLRIMREREAEDVESKAKS